MPTFLDDDAGYLTWLARNPNGYVLNAYRNPTPGYLVLHRTSCHTISGEPARGSRWTHDYRKICGQQLDLEQWAGDEFGATAERCGVCF